MMLKQVCILSCISSLLFFDVAKANNICADIFKLNHWESLRKEFGSVDPSNTITVTHNNSYPGHTYHSVNVIPHMFPGAEVVSGGYNDVITSLYLTLRIHPRSGFALEDTATFITKNSNTASPLTLVEVPIILKADNVSAEVKRSAEFQAYLRLEAQLPSLYDQLATSRRDIERESSALYFIKDLIRKVENGEFYMAPEERPGFIAGYQYVISEHGKTIGALKESGREIQNQIDKITSTPLYTKFGIAIRKGTPRKYIYTVANAITGLTASSDNYTYTPFYTFLLDQAQILNKKNGGDAVEFGHWENHSYTRLYFIIDLSKVTPESIADFRRQIYGYMTVAGVRAH